MKSEFTTAAGRNLCRFLCLNADFGIKFGNIILNAEIGIFFFENTLVKSKMQITLFSIQNKKCNKCRKNISTIIGKKFQQSSENYCIIQRFGV